MFLKKTFDLLATVMLPNKTPKSAPYKNFGLLLLVGATIAGCVPTPQRTDLLLRENWMPATPLASQKLAAPRTCFCYQTLGDPDCWDQPADENAGRLLGAMNSPSTKEETFTAAEQHMSRTDHHYTNRNNAEDENSPMNEAFI